MKSIHCSRQRVRDHMRVCDNDHITSFVAFEKEVIDRAPFTGGKMCIGKTGMFVNDRLRERRTAVIANPAAHLAISCTSYCGGVTEFHRAEVVRYYKGKVAMEVFAACRVKKEGNLCVSPPSLDLIDDELAFLSLEVFNFVPRLE